MTLQPFSLFGSAAMAFRFCLALLLGLSVSACSLWTETEIAALAVAAQDSVQQSITLEKEFHITSYSSGGGMTRRSGYTTYRLAAYHLEDGSQAVAVQIGSDGASTEFLGGAGGKLWFYTSDKTLGFHSRSPATLEVIDRSADLETRNAQLSSGLVKEAMSAGSYFAVTASGQLFVTTAAGNQFLVDASTFQGQPVSEKPSLRYPSSPVGSVGVVSDSFRIRLEGSPRKSAMVEAVYHQVELERRRAEYEAIQKQAQALHNARYALDTAYYAASSELKTIGAPYGRAARLFRRNSATDTRFKPRIEAARRAEDSAAAAAQDAQRLVSEYRERFVDKDASQKKYPNLNFLDGSLLLDASLPSSRASLPSSRAGLADAPSLQRSDKFGAPALYHELTQTAFVLSKNKIGNDFTPVLSALSVTTDLRLRWTVELTGIHEKSKSEGDLKAVTLTGNRLLVAYKKTLFCIDVESGKVLWQKGYE